MSDTLARQRATTPLLMDPQRSLGTALAPVYTAANRRHVFFPLFRRIRCAGNDKDICNQVEYFGATYFPKLHNSNS